MTKPKHSFQSNILQVNAPARLHMGFIDVSGVLGRRFGSIGVALNELGIRMRLTRSQQLSVSGVQSQRARIYAERFFKAFQVDERVDITIDRAIPEHAGLGSGTQLALSVGVGLNRLFGLNLSLEALVALMGRGNRSGIGIGAFCGGGLVVDGGQSDITVIPPVISQLQVPDDWRFILILDNSVRGIHGEHEIQAFNSLPNFPADLVTHLSHLVFMRGLPAVVENNLPVFGDVITELQATVGDYFAALQGGRFTSKTVEQAVLWLQEHGVVGVGQSSWGPTGFCLVSGDIAANELIEQAQQRFNDSSLEFMLATVSNTGSCIKVVDSSTDPLDRQTEFV